MDYLAFIGEMRVSLWKEASHRHPLANTHALSLTPSAPAYGTVTNWCHCNARWYCAHIQKVMEGEIVLLPNERGRALFFFFTSDVLTHSSHLVPIMLGIQAATELHITVKHPNKHGRKCQTIHHLLPMESRTVQTGQTVMVVFFFLFSRDETLTVIHLVQYEEMTTLCPLSLA